MMKLSLLRNRIICAISNVLNQIGKEFIILYWKKSIILFLDTVFRDWDTLIRQDQMIFV